tara:strand:+ start:525 stop:923 length:399 start_codon:yes stop_codon:yes gene_type:complete
MHKLPITIYYEDTDAQGVVYYANYLKFFERARTEYLREAGYKQKDLMKKGAIFMVRGIKLDFKKPSYLDDLIEIRTQIIKAGKVSFDFSQNVFSSKNELLCEGLVKCGCLDTKEYKPKPLPPSLHEGMKSLL